MLSRRTFLRSIALPAGLATLPGLRTIAGSALVAQSSGTSQIILRRTAETPQALSPDFIGLGYEMSSVATLGLLSPENERYVRLVKQLGKRGVLRVGGIVADYTRYVAEGTSSNDRHNTVINRQALEQFAAFLKEVNWTAIWSLNFAQGTLDEAVAEATAVARALGESLQAVELGNEVENYGRNGLFRKAPYTYAQYRAEYAEWHAALSKAVPHLRFAAPDTASDVEWVEEMAQDSRGTVQLLTTHYYRNGQKQGSAAQLTHADPGLLARLVQLRRASLQSRIPWRMCEANSFSGGGLPGVSDTLLGALWTLDFMSLLASHGCAGVNIETGVNQLGFVSCYSPIQDDGHGNNTAGASYYGMLAFAAASAGCGQAVPLTSSEPGSDLTAYGFGSGGGVRSVAVINRGVTGADVSVADLGIRKGNVQRLSGPESDSQAGITFGGSPVDSDGRWSPSTRERMVDATVRVPAMSAAILRAS